MKTPIKNLKNKTNSFSIISSLIPKGSVVNSYPIYDCDLETKLSESDRFVIANSSNYVVFEFWFCLKEDPERIVQIAESLYPMLNENTFDILKKNWHSYKDPFVRSALFFLLNRCSNLGMITHGELDTKNYNAFALRDLKNWNPTNIHLNFLKPGEDFVGSAEHINLVNCGAYRASFLENEQILGQEETEIKHREILTKMKQTRSILLFKYHPALVKNANYSKVLLDKYGRQTEDLNSAKEILLYNV